MGDKFSASVPAFRVVALVLNPIDIKCELPFELATGSVIDKATDEQILQIQEHLEAYVHPRSWVKPRNLYENGLISSVQNDGSVKTEIQPLDRSDWRYYVVKTSDNGVDNIDLNLVANISNTPLQLGALYFQSLGEDNFGGTAIGSNPGVLYNYFSLPREHPVRSVNSEDLAEIRDLFATYRSVVGLGFVGGEFPEVRRAVNMFNALHQLPEISEFHPLGLFAIIEMLITHNPKLEDRGDSITHQMQSKIPLLSHRFDRALDYQTFFENCVEKKVWSALYKFRSVLAHGGEANFGHGDLAILKASGNATNFLRQVVKALLRHSLKEPQLYRDLRNC